MSNSQDNSPLSTKAADFCVNEDVQSNSNSITGTKDRPEPDGKLPKRRFIFTAIKYFFAGLMLMAACLIFFSTNWVMGTFGLLSPDELFFHLKVPLQGTEGSMISAYLLKCLLPSAAIIIACIAGMLILIKNEHRFKAVFSRTVKFFKKFIALFTTAIFLGSVAFFAVKMDFPSLMDYMFNSSKFVEDNYVDPETVALQFPEQKRNLIYLFLESMENTYASEDFGGAQPVNLIPGLTDLAFANTSFSNTNLLGGAHQLPGTNWTIAAMVSQTAGIPLKIPIQHNSYGEYDSFLPGAYTMGDILESQGYNQTLLLGSDAEFGGRKDLFTQHGNVRILDYFTAIDDQMIAPDYKVWWGYEDEILFRYANQELTKLAYEDNPFCFTMLTVDTHFVGGYVCNLCEDEFDNQYSNVITCSSRQVANFVKWLQKQDFYDNTTIVIAGDHLSMDKEYFEDLDPDYIRTTYNVFINSAIPAENTKNRDFATFDMFPTVLASIGVVIDGNRLGLGTNLFSGKLTLIEQSGIETVNAELKKNSKFYDNKFIYDKS